MDAARTPVKRWLGGVFGTICLITVVCTPPPFEFMLTNNYQREHFSGRDISGAVIGLCMLLGDTGDVPGRDVSSAMIGQKFRSTRPDLLFREPDSVFGRLQRMLPDTEAAGFRSLLYHGDVVALQALDTVWKNLGYDFLLVVRLRRGMYIKTFNQIMRKRFLVEAELWDCTEAETVWRVIIDGKCSRPGYSDRQFLLESLVMVATALPSALPAYDTKSW